MKVWSVGLVCGIVCGFGLCGLLFGFLGVFGLRLWIVGLVFGFWSAALVCGVWFVG